MHFFAITDELETESRVKTELQKSVESQTKKLTEMQTVVQQQRQEIDKLRGEREKGGGVDEGRKRGGREGDNYDYDDSFFTNCSALLHT